MVKSVMITDPVGDMLIRIKNAYLAGKENLDLPSSNAKERIAKVLEKRDIVKAYILLIEKGKAGQAYNVCSGKAVKIQKLLDLMLKNCDKKIKVEIDSKKYRPVEVLQRYGTYRKLNKLCGWKPKITFEKTLRDLLDYWREHV